MRTPAIPRRHRRHSGDAREAELLRGLPPLGGPFGHPPPHLGQTLGQGAPGVGSGKRANSIFFGTLVRTYDPYDQTPASASIWEVEINDVEYILSKYYH